MSEVRFLVNIDVANFDALLEAAKDCGYEGDVDDISEIIETVVINADKAPVDTGFEIVSSEVAVSPDAPSGKENAYYIDFHLRILDETAFITEARRRYYSCWGQNDWLPKGLSEAGYEILVASNGNSGSPMDSGYEIVGTKYYFDLSLSSAVIEKFSDEPEAPVPGM